MKRVLLTALFVLIGSLVFAQERPAIAVFPFEDMDKVFTGNESVFFYRRFSNEFVNKNNGRFRVVPRQDVEKLINTEMDFQLSDFSAKAKTAEMRRVLDGVQILSGYIGKIRNKITISISLFTYPDLEQLPGGIDVDVADLNELFEKIPVLVQSMQNKIVAGGEESPETEQSEQKSSWEPPIVDPVINFTLGIGGGNILKFVVPEAGFQAGIALDSNKKNYFSFLIDITVGLSFNFSGDSSVCRFVYNLGGLVEYRLANVVAFNIGGGMGGLNGKKFPFIRGEISAVFNQGESKLGLFYDYNFDYGFRIGLRYYFNLNK